MPLSPHTALVKQDPIALTFIHSFKSPETASVALKRSLMEMAEQVGQQAPQPSHSSRPS